MNRHYRQGDVLLLRVDKLPAEAVAQPKMDKIVLAFGETTGHAHVIAGKHANVHLLADGEMFVEMKKPGNLTHEEHADIALTPGIYQLVRQREYLPNGPRIVFD